MFFYDFSLKVQKGINEFLFKLLILRYLMDSEGKMWKCSHRQLYLIEILRSAITSARTPLQQVRVCIIILQKLKSFDIFFFTAYTPIADFHTGSSCKQHIY